MQKTMMPRSKAYAQKPGAYQIATQGANTTLNSGDTLKFKQFITGYGEMSNAKIQAYFSAEVFDEKHSTIRQGIIWEKRDGLAIPTGWGAHVDPLDSQGFCAQLHGGNFADYPYPAYVFDSDTNPSSNRVLTELQGEYAPFEFSLKLKKNASPGIHFIDFYFTYFNGEVWTVSKERVEFKITNSFEKHSGTLSLLAAIALIVTIVHDGIGPLIETAHDLGIFISAWRFTP
jgi:hypothetical protein